MRISDWSSDVCSSDLRDAVPRGWLPSAGIAELSGAPGLVAWRSGNLLARGNGVTVPDRGCQSLGVTIRCRETELAQPAVLQTIRPGADCDRTGVAPDRKSTRLNSIH